jgi:hypothetical protein
MHLSDEIANDEIKAALKPSALRQAAKDGDKAAQALISIADDTGMDLMDFAGALGAPSGTTPEDLRRMAAFFLCKMAVENAPSKRARKTARRYLETVPDERGVKLPIRGPSMMPWDGPMIDAAEKVARDLMIDAPPGGVLPPHWILHRCGEPEVAIFATPWESDVEKIAVAEVMRDMMRRNGVDAYAFVAEGWATDSDDPARPRDSHRRREIVHAFVVGHANKTKMWSIVRDAAGHVVDLECFSDDGDRAKGPLTELLDDQPTVH